MREYRTFFGAVWKQWAQLLTGGPLSAVLILIGVFLKAHYNEDLPVNISIGYLFLSFHYAAFFVWKDTVRERDEARVALNEIRSHPIKISYTNGAGSLVTATVTNLGGREERVKTVQMVLFDKNQKVKEVLGYEQAPNSSSLGHTRHYKLRRCKGFPHVMPPRSSFEAEFYRTFETLVYHGIGGFYIVVKLEDGTEIQSESWFTSSAASTDNGSGWTDAPGTTVTMANVTPRRADNAD